MEKNKHFCLTNWAPSLVHFLMTFKAMCTKQNQIKFILLILFFCIWAASSKLQSSLCAWVGLSWATYWIERQVCYDLWWLILLVLAWWHLLGICSIWYGWFVSLRLGFNISEPLSSLIYLFPLLKVQFQLIIVI